MSRKTALVCGAGGFKGGHLVHRLKKEGFWVRGVDLEFPEFRDVEADDFVIDDLHRQRSAPPSGDGWQRKSKIVIGIIFDEPEHL